MKAPAESPAPAADFAACTLEPDPRSIGMARNVATSALSGWHLHELVDSVVSVASELVTNALRHGLAFAAPQPADPPVVLSLLRRGPEVVCAVFDPGAGVPRVCEDDIFAESGRGMRIVESLSDTWGWSPPGPNGKAVWASFGTGPGDAARRSYEEWPPLGRHLLLVEALTGSTPLRLRAVA